MGKHVDDVNRFNDEIRKSMIEIQNKDIEYKEKKIEEIQSIANTPTEFDKELRVSLKQPKLLDTGTLNIVTLNDADLDILIPIIKDVIDKHIIGDEFTVIPVDPKTGNMFEEPFVEPVKRALSLRVSDQRQSLWGSK